MKVYDFLLSIASALGDANPKHPFRRYTLTDLSAYYQEALCFVAAHRPDLMTEYVLVKLESGAQQDARCCGCQNVIEVVSQVDANGNIINTFGGGAGSQKQASWFRPTCRATSTGGTILVTATIDANMNGMFTVSPPVPPGQDIWVKVKCVTSPSALSEADIMGGATTGACTFLPAIRSYVMFRALGGDRNATGASAEAQMELKFAFSYLGLQWKAEQEHGGT